MQAKQSYTLAEVAARWSCSHSSVLALVRSGQLPAVDVSTNPAGRSRYVVLVAELEAFEARRTTKPAEAAPSKRRRRVTMPAGGVIEFFK